MPASQPNFNARKAAALLVSQILGQGGYTNIVLSNYLRKHSLSSQNRRFLTQLVYGTVKASGSIDWYLAKAVGRPLAQVDEVLLQLLRLSFYQLLYLDSVPPRAVVNEGVEAARELAGEGAAKFVNGVLRGFLRQRTSPVYALPRPEEDLAGYLALTYSHPRFLVKRWLGAYGREAVVELLRFNNQPAPLSLRVNSRRLSREELAERLQGAGIATTPSVWSREGLNCTGPASIKELQQAAPGLFYIQGEEAQLVAPLLTPEPGERLLDLCAAPGGKSTHLAQLLGQGGRVTACDIYPKKLRLLQANARWLGLTNIDIQLLQDGRLVKEEWLEAFDGVLVDAPCSGLGVLRQRAELRWRRTREELKVFAPLQTALLTTASRYVKPQGRLLYSTCTIEASENHYVVEAFLAQQPQWRRLPFPHPRTGELVEELQLLPQQDGIDGGYICLLQRCQGGGL